MWDRQNGLKRIEKMSKSVMYEIGAGDKRFIFEGTSFEFTPYKLVISGFTGGEIKPIAAFSDWDYIWELKDPIPSSGS